MLRSSFSVSNQMNCEMKCFVTFGFFYMPLLLFMVLKIQWWITNI